MSKLLKDIITLPEFTHPNDCKILHLKPGDTILHEGEESMGVYFILDGKVSINKRVVLFDGRHIESGFTELGENETFGELNLFDGAPRSASFSRGTSSPHGVDGTSSMPPRSPASVR